MFIRVRHIHFIGIGGIGMSGIAEVLLNLGYVVTGSDLKDGPSVRRLRSLGAHIAVGHAADNVKGAHVVVISSAVKATNVEVAAAESAQIPVIPRAEMLAELMRMKYGLAVAGAHGKTTTTSMLATILTGAGLDPTVVIGGRLSSLGSNAKLGKGPYLVAEADESDGTFLLLSPSIAVVTNIDPEHLDHYRDIEHIKATFVAFLNKVPFFGASVVCVDNENVRAILPEIRKRVVTYGISVDAELRPEWISFDGTGSRFTVCRGGRTLGQVHLAMPGMHNVLNAVGALGAALELDVPFDRAAEALSGFTGVGRRFQHKGEVGGVTVIDDYAHHPTELRATLDAARQAYGSRRIVAAFQPHRFSRTRDLAEDFAVAFKDADVVLMGDIYGAGEAPIEGVDSEGLCARVRAAGHPFVQVLGEGRHLTAWLEENAMEGDVLLTLGAGDIWKVGEAFLEGRGAMVIDPQG